MIEKLFEGCENLGWSVSEDQDAGTVELESYSPAGENLVVTVEKENFAEKVDHITGKAVASGTKSMIKSRIAVKSHRCQC